MSKHVVLLMVLLCGDPVALAQPEQSRAGRVRQLCHKYLEGFASPQTDLAYHHRLNGPRGLAGLADPREIAAGTVQGKPMPYGYGSGIQDVALENGQLLFALCDAQEATGDAYFAATARRLWAGFRRLAAVSPEPGFVPRGPHPDGKSYYRDSSRDQHAAFVEALWRYGRWPQSTAADRQFITEQLDRFAGRMERNGWQILVEDNSRQAHVGFTWLQRTSVGAVSLLSVLAQVADATGSQHWHTEYERFGQEKESLRWRQLLHPDAVDHWPQLTLYSNQFSQALEALRRAEEDPQRSRQLHDLQRRLALRALEGNVFDPQCWRRLDWAGQLDEPATEAKLLEMGLSLTRHTTVLELHQAFDPQRWRRSPADIKNLHAKLCFGLPTVACHAALLCGDPDLLQQVTPTVEKMVDQMLILGDEYQHGENFNRAVTLGLLLVARQKHP